LCKIGKKYSIQQIALHPVRVDAVRHFTKGNEELKMLNELIKNRSIKEVFHNGKKFYAMADELQT
jgi:ribonuclease D